MEPSIIAFNSNIEYFNLEKLKKFLGFIFKAKFRPIDLKLIFYITIILNWFILNLHFSILENTWIEFIKTNGITFIYINEIK